MSRTAQTLNTDYGYERIGGDSSAASKRNDGTLLNHQPLGATLTHVIRAGDTLQSIAAQYYGAPGR